LCAVPAAGHKINKFIYLHSQRRAHTLKTQREKLSDAVPLSLSGPGQWKIGGGGEKRQGQLPTPTHTHKGKPTNKQTHIAF